MMLFKIFKGSSVNLRPVPFCDRKNILSLNLWGSFICKLFELFWRSFTFSFCANKIQRKFRFLKRILHFLLLQVSDNFRVFDHVELVRNLVLKML